MAYPWAVRIGRGDGVPREGGGGVSHAPLPGAVRGAPAPGAHAQPRDHAEREGSEKSAGERRGEQVTKNRAWYH